MSSESETQLPAALTVSLSTAEVAALFKRMDVNGNGRLSMAEIQQTLASLYPESVSTSKDLATAFKLVDRNRSGFLESTEFPAFIYCLIYLDKLQHVFKALDKAKSDGQLDYSEFKRILILLKLEHATEKEISDEFKKMDVDGSGGVSLDEFCVYAAVRRVKFDGPAAAKVSADDLSAAAKAAITRQPSFAVPKLNEDMDDASVRTLFDFFQGDRKDGQLALDELSNGLRSVWPEQARYKLAIAHGFSKCDINKDALLDKSEFHSFIKMLSYYDMLYKQFLIMDASNDGAITYEEFEAFYLRLEPDVQLSKLHADFDAIDKSDDSEITAFELCFYLADAYARSKQSTLQSLKSMIGGLVRKKDKEAVVSTKTDVDMLVATKDELESVALANSSIPKTAEQTATSSSPAPQAKVEFRPEVAAAVVKKTGALTLNINLTAKDAHELFMLFDCGNQNGRYETKVENVSADENLMHVPFIQTQLGRGGQEYAYNVNMCFSFNYTHLPLSAIRDVWPDMYRHRRAFIRAFRAADKDQDGLIDESEFTALLRFLAYYDLLFQHFDKIDSDDDRRLTLNEFKQGHQLAGIKISDQQAEQLFMSIDKNNGGLVLFDEFCMFMATTYKPKELDAAYADIAAKNGTGAPKASMKMDRGATLKPQKKVAMAQQEQHVAPQTAPQAAPNVPPATLNPVKKPAALLSKKTTARVSTLTHKLTNEELKELFARFDVGNGNGFLSLAEIDKAVRDLWPEMYMHRPALMRAYKAADKTKDGFIIEDEFADMLRFLAYYDLMYQHFDGIDTDNDRRVSFAEFKKGHELAGIRIPEQQLHMAFCAIDLNAGGVVLFDEFCMYMAKTYRPTGMDQRLAAVAVANNATYEGAPAASQPQSHGRLTTQASPQMRRGQAPGGMGPMESGVKSMSIGRSDAGKASPFQQRFGAQLEEANTASGTKATGTGPAPRRAQQPQPTQHATSTSTTRAAPSSSQYAVSLASMHAVPSPSQQQKQSIFDGTIEGPTPARLSVAADEALRHEIRSLTHLVRFEQTEKHKLEATVMALKEHITRLGGNANDVQAAWPLSSFDTMTTLNAQLQEKLLQERQRYANLEHTLRLTKEKLLVKEDETKRRWVDDTRSIRSNQIRYMNDEVREKQLESQKFSRQYDEVSRKLAEEQEHSKRLADEILRLRTLNRVTEAQRPRREALDERY